MKIRPKKIQACMGFWLMTSAILVQCTTNWANKPNGRSWIQILYRIPHLHPQTIPWVFELFKIGGFKFCPFRPKFRSNAPILIYKKDGQWYLALESARFHHTFFFLVKIKIRNCNFLEKVFFYTICSPKWTFYISTPPY